MGEVSEQNRLLGKTFLFMFLGLLVSAGVAWFTYSSGFAISLMINNSFYILLFLELAVVLIFDLLFKKLSSTAVGILYFVYAIINGLTLSVIFYVYELNSIIGLFLASALVFGVLSYIGYKTNKDLSNWGPYITTFLIAGLILSLINIFVQNPTFDLAVDWIILAIFCGVTIYDLNKIKEFELTGNDMTADNIAIYCAMQLYLDFINIFLRILSIFGKRRD